LGECTIDSNLQYLFLQESFEILTICKNEDENYI